MESQKNSIRIFNDGVAIITGGASGIGRALSEELAHRGCEVVLADLQIELAEEVAAGIRAGGGKATGREVDVRDFAAVEALVQETVERTSRLDYMFNNAGIGIGGEVHRYGVDDWDRIIDVNLRGVTNGVQAAYQAMLKQGFGHIVNTASMAGLMITAFQVGYTATKHAIVGLSKALRVEAVSWGIRVSVLCPGVIRTPILRGGKYGKMLIDISPDLLEQMFERAKPMPADLFARKVLDAVAKNKAIIVFPAWWKIFWWLNRLSPSLGILFARKGYKDTQKEFQKLNAS